MIQVKVREVTFSILSLFPLGVGGGGVDESSSYSKVNILGVGFLQFINIQVCLIRRCF
jgi:hypothetical protein